MSSATQYKTPSVADLAWAVSSPPLLYPQAEACDWYTAKWFEVLFDDIAGHLAELDRNPGPLEALLAQQKDLRLGNYFETLWAYALSISSRYQLLERNLQVIDGERTVGEFDFIVKDNDTGRCSHWELAVKFYLGLGDTTAHACWHGPHKKDRLDRKVAHLRDRQTLLSQQPRARQLLAARGIRIDDCGVILKGRLFYPWKRMSPAHYPESANPSHLRSQWLTLPQFVEAFDRDDRFKPLIGRGWMAKIPTQFDMPVLTGKALIEHLECGNYRLPLQVDRLKGPSELETLFIVDKNWPLEKT